MAYYLVKYEGKHYVNRELAKAHYGVGDAGLFALIADGALVQKKILDCYVYGEGEGCPKKMPKASDDGGAIRYQDIDAQTACIENIAQKNDEEISKKVFYQVPFGRLPKYELDEVSFIRMQDVFDPMKYRMFDQFPAVCFLGKKYIAINALSEKSLYIIRK